MQLDLANCDRDLSRLKVGDKVLLCRSGGEVVRPDNIQHDYGTFVSLGIGCMSFNKSDGEGDGYFIIPSTPELLEQWEAEQREWGIGVVQSFLVKAGVRLTDAMLAEGKQALAARLGPDLLRRIEQALNAKESP